jgi:protease-4
MYLLWALVSNLVRLLFWPLRARRRARAAPEGAFVQVEMRGTVAEITRDPPLWKRQSGLDSLARLGQLVEIALGDSRVAGLVVSLRGASMGTATATSLRELLLRARQGGKRVVVYLPLGGGTREVFVASAADRILVGPQTELAPLGFAVETHYLAEPLGRAGIEIEVLARGRYKTAAEFLTERKMSDAGREQLSALLDLAYETLLGALADGRRAPKVLAEQWINQGPWPATAAVSKGLADAIAYPDELAAALDPESPAGVPLVGMDAYLRRRVAGWRPWRRPRYVAVLELAGPIVAQHLEAPFPVTVEEDFLKQVERVRDNPRVLGSILYVNSPGGSALASDHIGHALRKLAAHKPLVACLGDVAASGGYLAAVGAPYIVAQPTTLTGSIGVVAARPSLGPLFERLGIATEVVKRGAHADLGSPARRLSEEERRLLEREIDEIYAGFVEAVATGRRRPVADIEPLASGRVWSGKDAAERGLVDELGGLDRALGVVRSRIGPAGERAEPRLVGPRRFWAHLLASRRVEAKALVGPNPFAVLALRTLEASELGRLAWTLFALKDERLWAWVPWSEREVGRR